MAASDFVLFRNIPLTDVETGGQTSTVGEPSVANNGRELFITGNWYASRSLDGGTSWGWVNPFDALPPVDGGFCCDQVVHYDRSRDLLFWLLQYVQGDDGSNTLRLAVKRGPTLGNDQWTWWDFKPQTTNASWAGEWFDYPDLEISNNFLYMTTNSFRASDDNWMRSVIFRFPLDPIAAGEELSHSHWDTDEVFSLRCTRGAGDVMYFAGHLALNKIRLFAWPETSDNVSLWDVPVSPWVEGSYSAPGPDGANWLTRCDGRITGAWTARGVIGFAWSANGSGSFPRPHVRVICLDESSKLVVNEPTIWHPDFAYAYPDICPNDRGHLGIVLFRGGGAVHPAHVVGIWDDHTSSNPNPWELVISAEGSNGPSDNKWGDYLACRRHSPDGLTWLGSGYTLQGGGTRDFIEPRVVHFGRGRDEGAAQRWSGA